MRRQQAKTKRWLGTLGVLAVSFLFAASALAADDFVLTQPKLQIPIPGLTLEKTTLMNGQLTAQYLPQYISGVYKFLLSIVGVVAGVSMIYGGFLWMTSGGAADRAKAGKKRIGDAVIGMVLAYGSYLILYLINPATVSFADLKIIAVQTQLADFEVFDDKSPEVTPTATGGGKEYVDPTYDATFQRYAPCAGMDWKALKAIAYKESSLNTSLVNGSGYIGLFQTKPANCKSALAGTKIDVVKCDDLTDPSVNTAVGAMMMRRAVTTIQAKCPNASLKDQFTMVYVNHNMGPGVLNFAIKNGGCDAASLRKGAIAYYTGQGASTASAYAKKYQSACLQSSKSEAECTGGPKFDFAVKTAQTMSQFGITSLTSSGGTCPLL